ncbi:hypothetical protein Asd1617_05809 [Shigella dysenteriae 1617]|uniref:Uncharacterized protein n=1 Tax=Shigella dysenteriae 1617 TaxID=754093 RepID=A0A0A6ZPJ6_SHIDY|nr:hypothetical protein Asd1617_01080 [Shigella dysenteriae 1617]AHA64222.1 hypothetical protein Asd1617_01395 [Shigella dysenteriae 1617]AHA65305.1 hypothetical protein Asd1617_02478 [Shigella dysenteriae 1617]AHA68636.1 hypothetical protein Asd1617_05809 [Shigella dysenteriae 1617]
MKNTCSTNWKHHRRLLKNTCSTNWKHHRTAYAIQHRHDHQRRLGQLWPGGAEG